MSGVKSRMVIVPSGTDRLKFCVTFIILPVAVMVAACLSRRSGALRAGIMNIPPPPP